MTQLSITPLLRSARLIRKALWLIVGVLALAATAVVAALVLDFAMIRGFLADMAGYEDVVLRPWQTFALSAMLLVQIGLWLVTARCAQCMFSALLSEDVDAASQAARHIARLLWLVLGWSILSITLDDLIASWHFPEGQRVLSIGFGTAQVSTLLAALLATFLSHAFVLGAALWQDHKEMI